MRIFFNDAGRLRSGWRVLLFVLAFFLIITLLVNTVLRLAYALLHNFGPQIPHADFLADLVFRFTMLAAALGAGYLCARLLERLPWRSLGLTLHRGWVRDLLLGFAIGFVSLALAVVIAAVAGGLRFSFAGASASGAMLRSLAGTLVILFVAALAEEALFRGYGLQTLTRAQLAALGLLLTSVPFGLAHLGNPNVVRGVTFANTALAGIWLGVAYLRTRSLWFPLGLHWSWNWGLGWFFGLPISGSNVVSNPLFQGNDLGPAWLTGGSYGIEGGVACTITLVVFTIFVWRLPWVHATPELYQLTSKENPVLQTPVVNIQSADDAA